MESMTPLPKEWFAGDAVTLAPKLLGKVLRYKKCAGIIVEVEAYTDDAASHARTLTARSRVMHETYGHWYVYFTYGMHHCVNVTAGKDSIGAVLIRAVEPVEGMPLMEKRRGMKSGKNLTNGPGKLTQAFGISLKQNGKELDGDFVIEDAPALPKERIVSGPRIGIRRATELPWRFWIRDNPYVSK